MEFSLVAYDSSFEKNVHLFFKKAFRQDNRILCLNEKDSDLANIDSHYMRSGCFWIIKDDKNVIHGTIALRQLGDCYEIRRFFVEKKYHNRGYGKLLLNTALQYAIAIKAEVVKVAILERSFAAQSLFIRTGFFPTARYNNSSADIFFKIVLSLDWRYTFQLKSLKNCFLETLILNPTENLPIKNEGSDTSFIDGLYVSERLKDLSDKIIFAGRNEYILFFEEIKNSWCQLLHASDVDLKTLSGLHAHMILFMCVLRTGDKVMLLPEICGGHYSTESILTSLGAQIILMQPDCTNMCIDRKKTEALIDAYEPDYIFVDRSEGLIYEDFSWLKKYKNSFKIFDASQYLSHVISGKFQNPFDMGFDMIISTLHKNYPGPQKGMICVKENSETWKAYQRNAKTFISSTHPGDIASSLQPLLKFGEFMEYAKNNEKCSRLLENELIKLGVPIVDPKNNHCRTMHTWIRCENKQKNYEYYLKLEQLGFLVNYRLLPYHMGYGLRIGTSAAVRCGLRVIHVPVLADIMGKAYHDDINSRLKKRAVKLIREVKNITA